MITLTKRPCYVGGSINMRTEKHGEEDVPAIDVPLTGIMIDAEELNALLEEPHAHNLLFNTRSGGKLKEPVFRKLKPFQHEDKFENCTVRIVLGVNRKDLELEDVVVSKLKLKPEAGGLTMLSCTVQCSSEIESIVGKLADRMNHEIDVEIEFGEAKEREGKGAQQDLAINSFGDGEEPQDTGAGKKRARRGTGAPPVH